MIDRQIPAHEPSYNEKRFLSNDRFRFSRVEINGKDCFLKQATMPEMHENIEHELLWSEFMNDVESQFPEARLRAPKIYDFQDDSITFEYIDAPLLCNPNDIRSLYDADFHKFVNTFVIFDQVGNEWTSKLSVNDTHEHTPYHQVDKSWNEWLAYTKLTGLVNDHMENQARQLVRDYGKFITPRIQHGDYKPWQIFDKDGEWIIFDGEHSSEQKPRYYDLAYMYARTFAIARDADNAARMLREFISQHNEDEDNFFNAFIPVLTSRSMGMFLDALIDNKKHGLDYTTDAQELFDRCMKRDLSALTK